MARIAALQAENRHLTERIVKLEEELALARLHRFAPKSEKRVDRVFNEAEEVAVADDARDDIGDEETAAVDLPDTGLPLADKPEGRKRGRKRLPATLPRERVEYDIPDDQKICPCCAGRMHRMPSL